MSLSQPICWLEPQKKMTQIKQPMETRGLRERRGPCDTFDTGLDIVRPEIPVSRLLSSASGESHTLLNIASIVRKMVPESGARRPVWVLFDLI